MLIRPYTPSDSAQWLELRLLLWPDQADDHVREMEWFANKPDILILLAEQDNGEAIGFLEAQIANRADGCETDRILYIEGWFVKEPYRGKGIGYKLMLAAEDWARARGITEAASDTWANNSQSQAAHLRVGFEEVERVVVYRKDISHG